MSSSNLRRVPLPSDNSNGLYPPPDSPVDSQQAESVYDYSSSLSDRSDDLGFGSLGEIVTEGAGKRRRADENPLR